MSETEGRRFRRFVREITASDIAAWRNRNLWRKMISAPFLFLDILFTCGLLLVSWMVTE